MAEPWAFDYEKFHKELALEMDAEWYRKRHLRRLRIVCLILLSPIWGPFWFLGSAVEGLWEFIEFLRDGP